MSAIHQIYALIFYFLLILYCNCQSFQGNLNSKLPYNYAYLSAQQQIPLQNQQTIQFSPLSNNPSNTATGPISASSNVGAYFDPIVSEKISRNILQLGQEILTKLDSSIKTKAQVFSPVCVISALALILLGSNGQTYEELKNIFDLNRYNLFGSQSYKFHEEFGYLIEDLINDFPNVAEISRKRTQPPWRFTFTPEVRIGNAEESNSLNTKDIHQVEVANGIFVQNGFSLRRDYESVVRGIYNSEITPLEFHANPTTAKNYINDWVDKKTHGKIKTIIADEIASDTNVIIASALYFKGLWEKSFLDSATQLSEFYPNGYDAPPIKVHMMANGGVFPFYDAKEYGCKIIGLPYKGNLSTMYIIHPYDSDAVKLHQFQASLTADKIEDMISKMTRKTTLVAIPKLHITNSINLKRILAEFGVRTLFNQQNADLSLLADTKIERTTLSLIRNPPQFTQRQSNIPLTLDRFGSEIQNFNRNKRGVSYKVESSLKRETEPLRLKDFILNKRITKHNPGKKLSRNRRQINNSVSPFINGIKNLESLRNSYGLENPKLFVEEIIHKIDLVVNERGTEGGAATVAYIRRSGTDAVLRADTPYIILVRHDLTKLPIFYGTIYEPTSI